MIYGAAGPIGGAVARTFASEGAKVYLAGRTRETVEKVAAGPAGSTSRSMSSVSATSSDR